jgi:menaquinone-dependent protoporphyrinogen oxidase
LQRSPDEEEVMKVLIVFGTREGMTGLIAERMASVARAAGHQTDVVDVRKAGHLALDPYDAVLVGASIHIGGYPRAVRRFIASHLQDLASKKSAFFSVCMSIASKNEWGRQEARRIAQSLPAKLGWKPEVVEVIAGALMFSKYNFLVRWAMRSIARREQGPDVDTEHDRVYTDWDAVERFVGEFLPPEKAAAFVAEPALA